MRTGRRLLCWGLVMMLCAVILGASIGLHHLAWAGVAAPGEQGLILRFEMLASKGQVDLDVPLKMQRLRQWCEDTNRVQTDVECDFVYVDQESFDKYNPESFRQLIDSFTEYKD